MSSGVASSQSLNMTTAFYPRPHYVGPTSGFQKHIIHNTGTCLHSPARHSKTAGTCCGFQRHAPATGDNGSQNKFNVNLADGSSGGPVAK